MFTIFTESPSEKDILQQDYATLNDRFHIKLQEAPAIAGILRSISYELFQSSPSLLAQGVTKLAVDSLHLKLSLSLYRQVLVKMKRMQELIVLYQDYFLQLSRIIEPPFTCEYRQSYSQLDEETSAIQHLQQLQHTPSTHRLITDFQEELQRAIGPPLLPHPFDKTRKTALPEAMQGEGGREPLELSGCEESGWWKVREGEELRSSSRELSQFQPHCHNLLQESINGLMREEVRFEREREEELARKRRAEESLLQRFTRGMRDKLLRAKLRRRRR